MILLEAPWPGIQTVTVLPNPQLNDSENQKFELEIAYSTDGTVYTYVKDKEDSRLVYSMRMSRMKALELREFLRLYSAEQMRLTDHNDVKWSVYLVTNPFSFATTKRAMNSPGNADVEITLELEGQPI